MMFFSVSHTCTVSSTMSWPGTIFWMKSTNSSVDISLSSKSHSNCCHTAWLCWWYMCCWSRGSSQLDWENLPNSCAQSHWAPYPFELTQYFLPKNPCLLKRTIKHRDKVIQHYLYWVFKRDLKVVWAAMRRLSLWQMNYINVEIAGCLKFFSGSSYLMTFPVTGIGVQAFHPFSWVFSDKWYPKSSSWWLKNLKQKNVIIIVILIAIVDGDNFSLA